MFSIHNSIINWRMSGLWMHKTYRNPKEIRKLFKTENKTTTILHQNDFYFKGIIHAIKIQHPFINRKGKSPRTTETLICKYLQSLWQSMSASVASISLAPEVTVTWTIKEYKDQNGKCKKVSWGTVQHPRKPRQGIMTKLMKVAGDIKICSASIQSKKIKSSDNF